MLPVFVDDKKYLISKPETHNSQPETEKFQKYLGKVTIFKSSGEVKPFVPGGNVHLFSARSFFFCSVHLEKNFTPRAWRIRIAQ
jgi:hypothetical protein